MAEYVFPEALNALNQFLQEKSAPRIFSEESIDELWTAVWNYHQDKEQTASETITQNVQLARQYISEFAYYTLSIGNEEPHLRDKWLYRNLLQCITNTMLAIYKLAFDGLDYQAQCLLRTLYELGITLLCITIDSEKRSVMRDATTEIDLKTWHQFFSPKQLHQTLEAYEAAHGHIDRSHWHKETYSMLSSYAHNDYLRILGFSYAYDPAIDSTLNLNLLGAFASRTEILLSSMNEIAEYISSFFRKLTSSPDGDISQRHLCSSKQQLIDGISLWNIAKILGILNRCCLFGRKYQEYSDKYGRAVQAEFQAEILRNTQIVCPICGNSVFVSDDPEVSNVADAHEDSQFRCSACTAMFSKRVLIEANAEAIELATAKKKEEVWLELQKLIGKL